MKSAFKKIKRRSWIQLRRFIFLSFELGTKEFEGIKE